MNRDQRERAREEAHPDDLLPPAAHRDDIPDHRKTWGWGADPAKKALDGKASKVGVLCSSCDDRFQSSLDLGATA